MLKGSEIAQNGLTYVLTRDNPTATRTEVFENVEIVIKGYFDVFKGNRKIEADKFHILTLKSIKPKY
jgi:hypothetical protein